jgi:uncharacterized repeat protein (TIGR03803 family)
MIAAQRSHAQAYTVLYQFNGTDGQSPYAHVTLDKTANLYGTTLDGGAHRQGVVFKLSGTSETVLHSFAPGKSGTNPLRGVNVDSTGNVYGTLSLGGSFGSGAVFKVNTNGQEIVLYSFTGGADGDQPQSDLVLDTAGNIYGTTALGGASGYGTIFKVDIHRKQTVLHSFSGGADGQYPHAGLVQDSAGNLYGTTGGDDAQTFGTVFKIDPTGNETVLYRFTGGTDGALPMGALIRDSAGNLYGTTYYGGAGYGVVFKLDPNGNETVLYKFAGTKDGSHPLSRLALDTAGNLYGTTELGGQFNLGTVFELNGLGSETVLHSFAGRKLSDGAYPEAGVIRDSNGNLYGTTSSGGLRNGIVFKLTP